jgi:uncharacterized membrane protein YtjA (UPF0391 family)
MLTWTLAFFLLAIVAAALGFAPIAAGAHYVAWILAAVFLALFVLSLLRRPSKPYR